LCGASAPTANPSHDGAKNGEHPKEGANGAQPKTSNHAPAPAQISSKPNQNRTKVQTDSPHEDNRPKWTEITDAASAFGSVGSFFTAVVLAISTTLLWIETKRLAKNGEDQHGALLASVAEAKRSGDIAKEVADTTRISVDIAQEALRNDRAWLWVKLISCSDIKPEGSRPDRWFLDVKLEFSNFGNSPAFVTSAKTVVYWIQGVHSAEPDPSLPANDKFKSVVDHGLYIDGWGTLASETTSQLGDLMIAAGKTQSGIGGHFTFNRDWNKQRDGNFNRFFVYSCVYYTDVRGVECETSVYKCFFTLAPGNLSSQELRQKYNYRK